LVWLRHRGVRDDDVLLAGYPKSGNTWLAFMLGSALFGRDVDFENRGSLVPGVERHRQASLIAPGRGRLLQTHEPWCPRYRRAVYLVRNPIDVATSYLNHLALFKIEVGVDVFVRDFVAGHLDGYGAWASHVSGWLDAPGTEVLVVRYEDLRADTETVLGRVLSFLDVDVSPDAVRAAIDNNELARMKAKEERARSHLVEFGRLDPNHAFVGASQAGATAVLDPLQRETIARSVVPVCERLGYDLSDGSQACE